MDSKEFLETVSGKKDASCIITTTTGVYEGVYLYQTAKDGLQMVIRPTGETRKMLEFIAIPDAPEIDLSKKCAIRVSAITNIEFQS